jgi:hypothetical protein
MLFNASTNSKTASLIVITDFKQWYILDRSEKNWTQSVVFVRHLCSILTFSHFGRFPESVLNAGPKNVTCRIFNGPHDNGVYDFIRSWLRPFETSLKVLEEYYFFEDNIQGIIRKIEISLADIHQFHSRNFDCKIARQSLVYKVWSLGNFATSN